MLSLAVATKATPALFLPAVLIATLVNHRSGYDGDHIKVEYADDQVIESDVVVLRVGGNVTKGREAVEAIAQKTADDVRLSLPILEWVRRSADFTKIDYQASVAPLSELHDHLTLRSCIVGYRVTAADLAVWGAIRRNRIALASIQKSSSNVYRWYTFIEQQQGWMNAVVDDCLASSQRQKQAAGSVGGSYDIGIDIPKEGVVTRFPPEPSGYLHIGHAKAALLNNYFAHEKSKGTLLLRFDDTNPSKESQEFEDSIKEDLQLLGISADRISYSSDYFQQMHDLCVGLIKDGKAYADNTDFDTMKAERFDGIESKCRHNAIDENLKSFAEMKAGSHAGQGWCIRAKISMKDPNKTLRDPVIYRCNPTPHHRTGSTWKVYPTYEFCAPILDSLENVTYALRTNEYRDRNAGYKWIQESLQLRPVTIWDFSRMNFTRTMLSKRKLGKLIDRGLVSGWDDPRLPTVRGMRRRGMMMEALRKFILSQGASQNIINFDWTTIWATNKKYIDPVAARYTAVDRENLVHVTVHGISEVEKKMLPKHRKNQALGSKEVFYSGQVLIDQADAASFEVDEEITLMDWGNAIVRKVTHSSDAKAKVVSVDLDLHLSGDFKITKKKITWLSEAGQKLTPVTMIDFDFLITKQKIEKHDNFEEFLTPVTEFRTEGLADCNVQSLLVDDIIQFDRKGYFRLDRPAVNDQPAIFFAIPTGKA